MVTLPPPHSDPSRHPAAFCLLLSGLIYILDLGTTQVPMTPRDPNNSLQAFLKDNPCTCLPDHTTQVSHGCLRSLGFLPPSAEHHQFPCNHYTSLLPTIVSSGHLHSMLSAPSSHNRSQRASSFRSCRSFPGRVPPRPAAVTLPQLLCPAASSPPHMQQPLPRRPPPRSQPPKC